MKKVTKVQKGKGKTITARKASLTAPKPTAPKPPPPPPTWREQQRQAAVTAPEGYKAPKPPPPPPKPQLPTVQPLCEFQEGQVVDIPGCYKGVRIDRIADGGVTVSGGGLSSGTVISRQSPAVLVRVYPATKDSPQCTVVTPDNGTDPVPAKDRIKPPLPPSGATEADLPPKFRKPAAKREGVCSFIDNLIMQGGRTAEEIRDLTIAQFPGRDPQATLSTVRTRPAHIKAKGQTPPPFKK